MEQLSIFDYIQRDPDIGETVYFATCGEIKTMIVTGIEWYLNRRRVVGMVGYEKYSIGEWFFTKESAKQSIFYNGICKE